MKCKIYSEETHWLVININNILDYLLFSVSSFINIIADALSQGNFIQLFTILQLLKSVFNDVKNFENRFTDSTIDYFLVIILVQTDHHTLLCTEKNSHITRYGEYGDGC